MTGTALALLVVCGCSEQQQSMQGDDEDDAGMASWDNSAEQRSHVTGKRVVSRTKHPAVLACPPPDQSQSQSSHFARCHFCQPRQELHAMKDNAPAVPAGPVHTKDD